jgi:hypothetical protein
MNTSTQTNNSTFSERFSTNFDNDIYDKDITPTQLFVGTTLLVTAIITITVIGVKGYKSIKNTIETKQACKRKTPNDEVIVKGEVVKEEA